MGWSSELKGEGGERERGCGRSAQTGMNAISF